MPHGYNKRNDSKRKVEYAKQHDNGEITKVIAEKVKGETWEPYVQDGARTVGLGRFNSKTGAVKKMKTWMKSNPGGMQMNEGLQFGGMDKEDGYSGWL